MAYISRPSKNGNTKDKDTLSWNPTPHRDPRLARQFASLEIGDRCRHRGVGRLTISHFQFGERKT
jgi:hypothetical protein